MDDNINKIFNTYTCDYCHKGFEKGETKRYGHNYYHIDCAKKIEVDGMIGLLNIPTIHSKSK